ncbi:hypothetical protein XENOCAPTIV_003327 [Xenoophorus captivus]|uniref:Uncharacterized protein n=1 Tax=Xenoophorus captivus TaxID=1517983 RepID=A0ABV0Q7R8_9TELE
MLSCTHGVFVNPSCIPGTPHMGQIGLFFHYIVNEQIPRLCQPTHPRCFLFLLNEELGSVCWYGVGALHHYAMVKSLPKRSSSSGFFSLTCAHKAARERQQQVILVHFLEIFFVVGINQA